MTYKFYRISKNIAYLLIIFSILLLHLGGKITWFKNHPLFAVMVFYCICAFSLGIVIFGIHAHLSKIETVKKTDSPIILIIFGSVLALLAYAPQIALYFSQSTQETALLSSETLESYREWAIDPKHKPEGRLSAAKVYYRETGELIEYLNSKGVKALYSPDKNDRNYLLKRRYFENRAIREKVSVLILLVFVVAFCFGFLLLLVWWTHKQRQSE